MSFSYRFSSLTLTIFSTAGKASNTPQLLLQQLSSETLQSNADNVTHAQPTPQPPQPPPRTRDISQNVREQPTQTIARSSQRSFRFFRGDSILGEQETGEDSLVEYCRSYRAKYVSSDTNDDQTFHNILNMDEVFSDCAEKLENTKKSHDSEDERRRLSTNSEEENNSNISNSSGRHSTIDTIDTVSSNNSNLNSISKINVSEDCNTLLYKINDTNETYLMEGISKSFHEHHNSFKNNVHLEEQVTNEFDGESVAERLKKILLEEQLQHEQVESLLPPQQTQRRISMNEVLDSLLALPSNSRSQSPAHLNSDSDDDCITLEQTHTENFIHPSQGVNLSSEVTPNEIQQQQEDVSDDEEFTTPRETMREITSRLSEEVSKMLPSELSKELSKELSSKLSSRFIKDIPDMSEKEKLKNYLLEECNQDESLLIRNYKTMEDVTDTTSDKEQHQQKISPTVGVGLMAELSGVLSRRTSGGREPPPKPTRGRQLEQEQSHEREKQELNQSRQKQNQHPIEFDLVDESTHQLSFNQEQNSQIQKKEHKEQNQQDPDQEIDLQRQPPKPPERHTPIEQHFATFSRLDASQRNKKSQQDQESNSDKVLLHTKQKVEAQQTDQERHKVTDRGMKTKKSPPKISPVAEKMNTHPSRQLQLNPPSQTEFTSAVSAAELKQTPDQHEAPNIQSPTDIPAFASFDDRTNFKLRYSYNPNTARRRPRPQQKLEELQQKAQEEQQRKIREKLQELAPNLAHNDHKPANVSSYPQIQNIINRKETQDQLQHNLLQQQQKQQRVQQQPFHAKVPGEDCCQNKSTQKRCHCLPYADTALIEY